MGRPKARSQARRQELLLPRHSPIPQLLPARVSGRSTTTSDAATETSHALGSELTFDSPVDLGRDLEHEIPQCHVDLGHVTRHSSRTEIVPESQSAFPSLMTATQPASGGCACLSVLYLLLENLRIKDNLTAPNDFGLLRNTIESASEVLTCERCPLRYFSIVQNAAMLGILCLCVAESYHRLMRSIDEEENRSLKAGEKKQISIHNGGTQASQPPLTETSPLFSVSVSPAQWGSMMRDLVRTEVFGTEGHRDKCLKGFITRLEQRQRRWHHTPPAPDCPPSYRSLCGPSDREPTCLKLIDNSKRLIDLLEL
ncbi:uncharacterized protein CTRU02_211650 [Colletotrichum truncatum]|uniref:Uncharacterized protein n=1 Tax=Colletotrichum truncatum TaxID=5467 RepID=A0ACC3YND4_COLTU